MSNSETVLMIVSIMALFFLFFKYGRERGYSKGWEDGYEDGKNYTYEILNILDDNRLVYVVRSRKKEKDGDEND